MQQFPQHPLTFVLQSEPDELSATDFLAKVGTWIAILNAKKEEK
jgi:hypothetical protein